MDLLRRLYLLYILLVTISVFSAVASYYICSQTMCGQSIVVLNMGIPNGCEQASSMPCCSGFTCHDYTDYGEYSLCVYDSSSGNIPMGYGTFNSCAQNPNFLLACSSIVMGSLAAVLFYVTFNQSASPSKSNIGYCLFFMPFYMILTATKLVVLSMYQNNIFVAVGFLCALFVQGAAIIILWELYKRTSDDSTSSQNQNAVEIYELDMRDGSYYNLRIGCKPPKEFIDNLKELRIDIDEAFLVVEKDDTIQQERSSLMESTGSHTEGETVPISTATIGYAYKYDDKWRRRRVHLELDRKDWGDCEILHLQRNDFIPSPRNSFGGGSAGGNQGHPSCFLS